MKWFTLAGVYRIESRATYAQERIGSTPVDVIVPAYTAWGARQYATHMRQRRDTGIAVT
jgi:hypothetical protein